MNEVGSVCTSSLPDTRAKSQQPVKKGVSHPFGRAREKSQLTRKIYLLGCTSHGGPQLITSADQPRPKRQQVVDPDNERRLGKRYSLQAAAEIPSSIPP